MANDNFGGVEPGFKEEYGMGVGMADPNNTAEEEQGKFEGGRTKIVKTEMVGESGRATGSSYDESLPSQKEGGKLGYEMPSDKSSFPEIAKATVQTSGDPNHTAIDADDKGMYPEELESKV